MRRVALSLVLIAPTLLLANVTAAASRITDPGSRLWLARLDHGDGVDAGRAVVTSPDGSTVFVAGSSWDGTGDDVVTVAYRASSGRELWRHGYGNRLRVNVWPVSMAASPTGDLLFLTVSRSTNHSNGWATIAYEASTGTSVWTRRYPARPSGLAVSPDGTTVVVAGTGIDAAGSSDFATVAYDAGTGAVLWARSYGRHVTDRSWEQASAVAVSPDGSRVFVSGSTGGTTADYVTLAYDADTGSRQWITRRRAPDFDEYVSTIGVSPDGAKVFVTGSTVQDLPQWEDSITVAYDASTGDAVWEAGTAAGSLLAPVNPASLTVSPDSEVVFVAGRRIGAGDWWDVATTAYDASSGDELWGRRFSGQYGFGTIENDIVLSPDGSTLYVTGATGSFHRPDYVTLAYDAVTGDQVWMRSFDGRGRRYDMAHSIAVAPDGTKVFVTGESDGSADRDVVTIAYAT